MDKQVLSNLTETRKQLDDKIILNLAEVAALCAHKMGETENCDEHAHYMDCLFATLDIVYSHMTKRTMENTNG